MRVSKKVYAVVTRHSDSRRNHCVTTHVSATTHSSTRDGKLMDMSDGKVVNALKETSLVRQQARGGEKKSANNTVKQPDG